jgi:hypothetical protein
MPHGKRHRRRTRKNRMRGGASMGNTYEPVLNSGGDSGWSYVNNRVGGLDEQYKALMGNGQGNQLNVNDNSLTMSGGRRRRRRSRRHRRGGSFGPVIADAIVPLGLLAAQQTYGRRTKRSRRSRRRN